mgnify:CR=1 FL=1
MGGRGPDLGDILPGIHWHINPATPLRFIYPNWYPGNVYSSVCKHLLCPILAHRSRVSSRPRFVEPCTVHESMTLDSGIAHSKNVPQAIWAPLLCSKWLQALHAEWDCSRVHLGHESERFGVADRPKHFTADCPVVGTRPRLLVIRTTRHHGSEFTRL